MSAEESKNTIENPEEHNRAYLKKAIDDFSTRVNLSCDTLRRNIDTTEPAGESDLRYHIKGELSPMLVRDIEEANKIRSEIRSKLSELEKLF